tara:strand:+ start:2525 stop:2788 length:264 start_codon:yes stop_codon:yes gene_type:complete
MAVKLNVLLLVIQTCASRRIKRVAEAILDPVTIVTIPDQKQKHVIGLAKPGKESAMNYSKKRAENKKTLKKKKVMKKKPIRKGMRNY